jgi:hypothetical protein
VARSLLPALTLAASSLSVSRFTMIAPHIDTTMIH